MSWSPSGPSTRALSESHGVRVGGATSSPPAARHGRGRGLRIVDLERETQPQRVLMRHRPSDLDLVDVLDLGAVGELEGRGRDAEDDDARVAVGLVRLELRKAERVPVEGERGVEVVGLEHEPELGDCHAAEARTTSGSSA